MKSRKLRAAVALALTTLLIVVMFSLVMGRQFHQRSWIAKAIHGAADATGQIP
jgi:divalent metal cation (Fe/Co/Zn/Cd) transporter